MFAHQILFVLGFQADGLYGEVYFELHCTYELIYVVAIVPSYRHITHTAKGADGISRDGRSAAAVTAPAQSCQENERAHTAPRPHPTRTLAPLLSKQRMVQSISSCELYSLDSSSLDSCKPE